MALDFSVKRLAIDKANTTLVVAVAVASFIVIFSVVASQALFEQMSYQSKVTKQKEKARNTLNDNLAAAEQLDAAYKEFVNSPSNALGGNPAGTGSKDGDNARIVLDALPSKYDFPGLATSIEKLIKENNFSLDSIEGTDDEIAQAAAASSANPQAVEIPFSVVVNTPPERGKELLQLFERSIRPFQIKKLTITSSDNSLEVSAETATFFQPEKNLDLKKEVVK